MKKFDSIASSILKSCLIAALFFSLIPGRSFAESNGDTRLSKIETDKCAYKPGETVSFKLDLSGISAGQKLKVKYYHLADKIDEAVYELSAAGLNEFSWQWLPPQKDFNGYLALVCLIENEKAVDSISIAVDVSSDWSKFPRYGFISEYLQLTQDSVGSVISNLNRHHINGVQFYDWHYKHHMPLKGTIDNPAPTWNDVANRTIYLSTIRSYINQAHLTGMKTMAYNLVYGAYSTAYMDGVKDEWGLYLDQNHQKRWAYDLPAGWAADLIL